MNYLRFIFSVLLLAFSGRFILNENILLLKDTLLTRTDSNVRNLHVLPAESYTVDVHTNSSNGKLSHFWMSTGLCPPDPHNRSSKFFLSDHMHQNLFHIGSILHYNILQVRIHWLLDLLKIKVKSLDNLLLIDFHYMDEFVRRMWLNNLSIGFELMGNPSHFFTDFENSTQVYLWRDLVKTVAERYINLYGKTYVLQWNFESWNEPDHHDFDDLNFTIQGFLNYYDACSEGLRLADESLKLGGPGGSCRPPSSGSSPFCWALLEHCVSGKNFFTDETGVRLDFISFHKKGNSSSLLILQEEAETLRYVGKKFPTLLRKSFYNDEADPMKTWSRPEWWRADATYASLVVKVIVGHIQSYYVLNEQYSLKNVDFKLLSNDNGFVSFFPHHFTQRTLLARFQINNTIPKYVQYVKKPVYAAMGLLSLLCEELLEVDVYKNGMLERFTGNNTFYAIGTKCKSERERVVVLLYNNVDTQQECAASEVIINFNSSFHKAQRIRWALYEINNEKTNPYALWEMIGSPLYPTLQQFTFIKDQEEPYMTYPKATDDLKKIKIFLRIPCPGISLLNICIQGKSPEKVFHIIFYKINNNALQISWKDYRNRCILTYNIEWSKSTRGPFIKLNKKKVKFPTFWRKCLEKNNCTIYGCYRVQAVDYWNRRSKFEASCFLK